MLKKQAVEKAGSVKGLCEALGITPSAFYYWPQTPPTKQQIKINKLWPDLPVTPHARGRTVRNDDEAHIDLPVGATDVQVAERTTRAGKRRHRVSYRLDPQSDTEETPRTPSSNQ